jgi:hypothetical protein
VSRGGKVRIQVTTIDATGNTVQIQRVKLSGKKHKKK